MDSWKVDLMALKQKGVQMALREEALWMASSMKVRKREM